MMNFEEWAKRHPVAAEELKQIHQPIIGVGGSSEAATQALIRVAASKRGYAMWRNNNGACKDETGRQLRFGLGNDSPQLNAKWKSSDLIGIGPAGRFVACEIKHPKWTKLENDRDRAQLAMLNQVIALGGIGFFATHVEHYHYMMEKYDGKTTR